MPRPKMFTVGLSAADREFLVKLTTTGVHSARMIMRARVLLELDQNAGPVPDRAVIAQRVGTSTNTVRAIAKRFAETDVTGEVEARLIALACSTPPDGTSDADCLGERHPTDVRDLHRALPVARVHHFAVANGDPDVADRLVEEPQVARLQVRLGDRGADPGHRAGAARQRP